MRHILQTVCKASLEASKVVQDCLPVSEDKVRTTLVQREYNSGSNEDENEGESEYSDSSDEYVEIANPNAYGVVISVGSSLKRVRPRFAICALCNKEYDVETNDKKSCIWHPGILLLPLQP